MARSCLPRHQSMGATSTPGSAPSPPNSRGGQRTSRVASATHGDSGSCEQRTRPSCGAESVSSVCVWCKQVSTGGVPRGALIRMAGFGVVGSARPSLLARERSRGRRATCGEASPCTGHPRRPPPRLELHTQSTRQHPLPPPHPPPPLCRQRSRHHPPPEAPRLAGPPQREANPALVRLVEFEATPPARRQMTPPPYPQETAGRPGAAGGR